MRLTGFANIRHPMIAAALLLASCGAMAPLPAAQTPRAAPSGSSSEPILRPGVFTDAEGRRYASLLRLPPAALRNGCAAMLIGGGSVFDLQWRVPGKGQMMIDGPTVPITIDGQSTHDADAIAESLVQRGFIVLQWSSIHDGDPAAARDPWLATGIPFDRSVGLARAALTHLRAQPEVDPSRVLLVGHSLGAVRALCIADENIIAIVSLAGAYLSYTRESTMRLSDTAGASVSEWDASGDGSLSPDEFAQISASSQDPIGTQSFEEIDLDGDGLLRGWEIASARQGGNLAERPEHIGDELRDGIPWPLDQLRELDAPFLAIFGGLDSMSLHARSVERFAETHRLREVSVVIEPHLGHQLSPQSGHLFGPIDPRILERLASWADEHCR